jgi:hypothetical protein
MRNAALAGAALLVLSSAGAEAQQCYRRVIDPPRYSAVVERVLVAPAREAREYVPAVTREVEQTVVVRPERTIARYVPPEYALRAEAVEVSPAHREWRTRDEDGEVIGCWVNVPARFAEVTRRVLVEPAHAMSQTIPEVTATRLVTVVVEPAHVVAHVIPAQYAVRERPALVSPGGAHWARLDACER